MNPYTTLGYAVGTDEATELSGRLAAWHDAMVAHERRLGTNKPGPACDEECPHGEAPVLWAEAVEAFGERAHECLYLRARATAPSGESGRSAASTDGDHRQDHGPSRSRSHTRGPSHKDAAARSRTEQGRGAQP